MSQSYLQKSAGFCYGVRRAVEIACREIENNGSAVVLGDLIHNRREMDRLSALGLKICGDINSLAPGQTVIIRAHGESPAVYDAIAAKGCAIADATCPDLSRIHDIVREQSALGKFIVIIGSPAHPEVAATAGYAGEHAVFEQPEQLGKWLADNPDMAARPACVVAQTTTIREKWEKCVELVRKVCTEWKIFDTICHATATRQREADKLARECGAMIVIGDVLSANTRKLAEICRANCGAVFHVEGSAGLDGAELMKYQQIGITAGASTPAWIIEEVVNMIDETSKILSGEEESFATMLEDNVRTLHTGDKVSGIVTNITPAEVQVDLGTKHAAYVPIGEMSDDPEADISITVKPGDEIEAFVVRVNDVEGIITLSKKRLDTIKMWERVEASAGTGEVLEGIVTEVNKGGVVVSVNGVRVFVPASHSGLPKTADMSALEGKKTKLHITEFNRQRRRVVGSIRAALSDERRAKSDAVWNDIAVGKAYTGTVRSIMSYGAFIDIGGVDGMLHISEMSWSRIRHPSDVMGVGDTIEVFVQSFDKEKRKISLGYRKAEDDPWTAFADHFKKGDVCKVKVVRLMPFGAFAEVTDGVEGLIHISQIANRRLARPSDAIQAGQEVDALITAIDYENKKISLSIRALLEPESVQEAMAVELDEAPIDDDQDVESIAVETETEQPEVAE